MEDSVRRSLAELVGRFGLDLCNDPRRCEALLRDVCGEHKREILALVNAAKEGVGDELRKSSAGMPKELILARLTKRLHEHVGLAEDLARWAVESWAVALGVASVKEFRFPFKCPQCGAEGNIATRLAGQKTRCPKCNSSIFIADNGREVYLAPDSPLPPPIAMPPKHQRAGKSVGDVRQQSNLASTASPKVSPVPPQPKNNSVACSPQSAPHVTVTPPAVSPNPPQSSSSSSNRNHTQTFPGGPSQEAVTPASNSVAWLNVLHEVDEIKQATHQKTSPDSAFVGDGVSKPLPGATVAPNEATDEVVFWPVESIDKQNPQLADELKGPNVETPNGQVNGILSVALEPAPAIPELAGDLKDPALPINDLSADKSILDSKVESPREGKIEDTSTTHPAVSGNAIIIPELIDETSPMAPASAPQQVPYRQPVPANNPDSQIHSTSVGRTAEQSANNSGLYWASLSLYVSSLSLVLFCLPGIGLPFSILGIVMAGKAMYVMRRFPNDRGW